MQYDLKGIAIRTGIEEEKLKKELQVMSAMQDIFIELANSGQKVALFGGTALNKIYYGERQRLSYDLDIESFDYEKTKGAITKVSTETITMKNAYRSVYHDVIIDLIKTKGLEEPKLLKARSILEFFDYPANSVTVPSYSLEYLLAQKTVAMLSRTVNKDIYDMWVGLQLLKDKRKYVRYVRALARSGSINLSYLVALAERYLKSGWDTKREKIDVINDVDIKMALGDVVSKLKSMRIA